MIASTIHYLKVSIKITVIKNIINENVYKHQPSLANNKTLFSMLGSFFLLQSIEDGFDDDFLKTF